MSTAAIIQPVNDNNDPHKILTLLDGSSISDERQEEDVDELQKQNILSYLNNESSNSSSTYLSPKRVPRLGPYLLLKTLGVGEFGKVKMGRHIETGQTVAVKLVKKENIDSSSQLDKIRMEIDILKTLNHPYIVKLLSVNETNTCIGMVLEFAQGGELFEYIYRQRYLKENEAKRLFSQLISCVYYMHQKNIVHRDLKLENILLDHRGNLIVTDFGFANQFTPITGDLMSTSCGSPVYAAPELVMTGRLYSGTGVDIWSCGIILYAMLCGYLPFDDDVKNPNGDNIGRLYRYIMANKPKYPSHLSHDSKDVIGKMLMPDPSARCKIEAIMIHPWLHQYKDQMSKSIEEMESEALELKQSLIQGIEVTNTLNDGDYVEEVCCDEDQIDEEEDENNSCCSNGVDADNASVCSSVSSSYSYGNNVDSIKEEIEKEHHLENGNTSPPTTPIPHAKEVSMTTDKLSRKSSHASQQQGLETASKSITNMSLEHGDTSAIIPVSVPENNDKQVKKEPSITSNTKNEFNTTTTNSASSSAHSSSISTPPSPVVAAATVNNKRHTIDTTTFNTHRQQEEQQQSRPAMPVQHSSLRAKLFSSVKRRNNHASKKSSTNNQDEVDGQGHDIKKSHSKRHSWQNIIHRHHHNSNNNLPLSPPSSPTLPEQSKSVRLLTWLKNKSPSTSSHHHSKSKKNKHNNYNISTERETTHRGESTSSSSDNSSNNSISREEDATIPIAKPSTSSLAHMHGSSNTPSRAPTVLSLMQHQQHSNSHRDHKIIDEEQISVESELRVHTGDMNRSALTSKPPMEVLLEINKILLILGIEVENKGGYKLHCIRRATSHYHGEALLDDRMNHLATSHQPGLSLPIYGHPSIDTGEEVLFSVEICRFENLSGLFSVDIQCLSSDKEESFAAYQFIGQKLLALLHLGNAIRNTNFNVMLSSSHSSSHTS